MFRLLPIANFREYQYLNIIQRYCTALSIVNGNIYNGREGEGKTFPQQVMKIQTGDGTLAFHHYLYFRHSQDERVVSSALYKVQNN